MVLGTEFWAVTVKRLKRTGKHAEIVAVTKQNLPLPGTFNEMAVALRKQIRERRKDNKRYNDLLRQLYHAAVWENFFGDINALCLREQGTSCKVVGRFIPRIKCDYKLIGYEHLDILGVNDVKWIVEAWGEPRNHAPARQINQKLHEQTVARFNLEKERELRAAGELFGGQQLPLVDSQDEVNPEPQPQHDNPAVDSGKLSQRKLIVAILIAAALGLVIILVT